MSENIFISPNAATTQTIAIIGLGYVGLPLAVAFAHKRPVIGFDIDSARVSDLQNGKDKTLQCSSEELAQVNSLHTLQFTNDIKFIQDCQIYIITVPTPVDINKNPDLRILLQASQMIGGILKKGDLVIYESTVYPGCTEEDCVPVLEKNSGLIFNKDFFIQLNFMIFYNYLVFLLN